MITLAFLLMIQGMVYSSSSGVAHYPQAELPAEPILFVTAPGTYQLELVPTQPKPVVGVFLVACRTGTFVCSDNGAEFHLCARWELADLGLMNPRYTNSKCIADRRLTK